MNGPLKLYKVHPIVRHDIKVDLPKCMYALKNIHEAKNDPIVEHHNSSPSDHISSSPKNKKPDIIDQVKRFLKNNAHNPEMAELEKRQQYILKQLADLREQLNNIRNQLKAEPKTIKKDHLTVAPTVKPQFDPNILPANFVINVNPSNPPYALEKIQKILEDHVEIRIKSFLHSTVSSLNEETKELVSKLESFRAKNGAPKVTVTLIWKDVKTNLELLVSPIPIEGEVNLLRYIARLVPNMIPYECSNQVDEIDSLLDVSHKIIKSRTKTERSQLIQLLNKSLGKEQYLTGSTLTVADLAAYSALKQATTPNDINVNLGKWFDRIEKL